MPMTCRVCRHPRAARIASLLAAGTSFRDIAKRFNLSPSAVHRHRPHARNALARVVEARQAAHDETLAEEIARLKGDAQRLAAKAEAERDYRAALLAVKVLLDVSLRLEEVAGTRPREKVVISFNFSALGGDTRRKAFPPTSEPPDAPEGQRGGGEPAGDE